MVEIAPGNCFSSHSRSPCLPCSTTITSCDFRRCCCPVLARNGAIKGGIKRCKIPRMILQKFLFIDHHTLKSFLLLHWPELGRLLIPGLSFFTSFGCLLTLPGTFLHILPACPSNHHLGLRYGPRTWRVHRTRQRNLSATHGKKSTKWKTSTVHRKRRSHCIRIAASQGFRILMHQYL